MIDKIIHFVTEDIWVLPDNRLNRWQAVAVKLFRVLLLSLQGFVKDLCPLRASALTLYTLLSIVPVIALLFGVAKGFGFEKMLQDYLLEYVPEQDSMMIRLIEFAENMLANTKGGVVAGIGIIILFWTVIKVIGNIEESFNAIWNIDKNRTLARKLSDYLSMMLLAPVLLILSSSITLFVKTQLTWLMQVIHLPEFGTRIVLYGLSFSPLLIMSVLFTFVLVFMPNRKVELKAGMIAGVFTGVLYQCTQWAYISLQMGASSYNAIYGSFAALPLFLIWLQLGWFVVLLGCELAFYIQNYEAYRHNGKFSELSLSLQKSIGLQIMHLLVSAFMERRKAMDAEEVAKQLALPLSVVQHSLTTLLSSGLVVELKADQTDTTSYHPAYDINRMTVSSVLSALEYSGINQLADSELEPFVSLQKEWLGKFEQSESNRLLIDIIHS